MGWRVGAARKGVLGWSVASCGVFPFSGEASQEFGRASSDSGVQPIALRSFADEMGTVFPLCRGLGGV